MKFKLATFEQAGKLVDFCNKFAEDIDIKHGRYVIDAKSILGVMGLVRNEVEINIVTDDENIRSNFENGIRKL